MNHFCQGVLIAKNHSSNGIMLDFDVIWSYRGNIRGYRRISSKNIIPHKYYWRAVDDEREHLIMQRLENINNLKDLLEYPLSDEFESSDIGREVYRRALERITGYIVD